MEQIHVIGGGDGIGRWLLEKVFCSRKHVFCYDINEKTLTNLPSNVTVCALRDGLCYEKYTGNFQHNDWILLAVPSTVFEDSVKSLVAIAKEGSLFVSLTSVQEQSINILRSYVPKNCTYLGCHPLFGPTVSSPVGQIVALIEFKDKQIQHLAFYKALLDSGLIATLTHLSASEHDRYMAIIQALTHFSLIGFVDTLLDNGLSPSELMKIQTPNFQFLYAFASRIIHISCIKADIKAS